MGRWIVKSAILLCLGVTGCALHQVNEQIEPPESMPESFSDTGEARPPDRWWEAFNDSELNKLQETALAENLGLRAAWSRLKQASAIASSSSTQPTVNVGASGARARNNINNQAVTGNNFDLNASISYEVDLWKRLASLDNANDLAAQASRQDLEAVALSLSASVARVWYGMVEQREQLNLLDELVEVNEKLLQVIQIRFSNAQATAVEVFQQKEQLANIRSQIPPAQAQLAVLEHQLAVLLGKSPTENVGGENSVLPPLPPLPQTGLPADLLNKRPDLRSAAHRLVASDYRLAAAIANRYPTLRLSGQTGYNAAEVGDLFSNWIWNLFAGLTAPILDGGNRKAEVVRNRAVVEEQVLSYERAVLGALQEVEDALILENRQHDYLDKLQTQLDYASKALESGRGRYLEGVGDFLVVLTEIQAVQRLQRSLIQARMTLINHRISLYQALGGDWTTALEPNAATGGQTLK